jgi:hypothetical protein
MIECKTLTKPQASISIKKEWLDKNQEEAFARGKQIAALTFDFGDNGNRYYIVREDDFRQFYNLFLKELEEDGS